jgi:hypothetical protein
MSESRNRDALLVEIPFASPFLNYALLASFLTIDERLLNSRIVIYCQ